MTRLLVIVKSLLQFLGFFRYFPSQGEKVHIFFTDLKLPEELLKLDHVVNNLESQTDIISSIDSWYLGFKKYYQTNFASEGNKPTTGKS